VFLLLAAIALSIAKIAAIEPVTGWSWWTILPLYGATAVWWALADALGYTRWRQKKKTERKQQKREMERRRALGLGRR